MWKALSAIRQNHALEHATIHLLTRLNPYVRLVGRTTPAGFSIYGPLSTEEVAAAASEAISRLSHGEAYLAVHPRCGTNLVVSSLLVGGAAFAAGQGKRRPMLERLTLALLAATMAAVLAQPVAHLVQERVTTTPNVDGVTISEVVRTQRGGLVAHRVEIRRE